MPKIKALFLTSILIAQFLLFAFIRPNTALAAQIGLSRVPDNVISAAPIDEEDEEWSEEDLEEDWEEDEEEDDFVPVAAPPVRRPTSPAATQPVTSKPAPSTTTTTTTTQTTKSTNPVTNKTSTDSAASSTTTTSTSTSSTTGTSDQEIQKQLGISPVDLDAKYSSLAKSTSRPKEDIIKLYSQYGKVLEGLNPENPKDLAEIEKLIEIVGVPKSERKPNTPTVKQAPKDDPTVNFSARSIPVRDAFATLARVSGKSITVSGQIQDRDVISVVEINSQPFTKAFLSLVEAADVDFTASDDTYTILKKRAQRTTTLSSSLDSTIVDLSLPLDQRYADLIYDNEDLSSIIKDVANKYGVDVVLTATPTDRVTLRVRGINVEDAFELLFAGSQFNFTRKEDTFVVYSSANKNFSLDKKTILFPLKYLQAQEAQKLLPTDLKNIVQVSENQNAFIAEASKQELTKLYEFLRTIDKPVPQVELNVKLVEVSRNFTRTSNLLQSPFTIGRIGQLTDSTDSSAATGVSRGFDLNLGADEFGIFANTPTFNQNRNNSNTKVNQRLLVTSGKSAKINFDEDINVLLNSADPSGQTIGVVQNQRIQRVTAGNSMDITPTVGAGGVVSVKVEIEVSANDTPNPTTGVPPRTVRRRLSSEIQVNNHETIAIGGLFDDRKNNGNSNEIPILSQIPIIGSLFTNAGNKSKKSSELIILITPHIRSGEDEQQVFIQAQGNDQL